MSDVMKPDFVSQVDWEHLVKKYDNLEEIVRKLNNNYPVQYLIGDVPFLNTIIKVDERVLIPRFETEYLVEELIKRINRLNIKANILDLGCGSGCISIALKKNILSNVTGVDISGDAICLAKENALLNKVDVNFINCSMFDISYENYDVIVSNPPYVSYDEEVGKEVLYEPQNALYALDDGLFYYKEIIKKISLLKNKPLLVAFEIGYQQGNRLKNLVLEILPDYNFELKKDLAGKDRYVFLSNNVKNN